MFKRSSVAVLMAVMAGSSLAATITKESDITPDNAKQIFGSKHVIQKLYDVGSHYEITLERNKDCQGKVSIKPQSMGLVAPIEYDTAQEYPQKGIWTMRFKLSRCDNTSVYNAIFMADNGKAPQVQPLYPGESNTDPRLYMDTLKAAIPLAKALILNEQKECKSMFVEDTKITQPVVNNNWSESWTFKACGIRKSVDIDFMQKEGQGTSFNIKTKLTK